MFISSVIPSSHFILWHPLFLPSIFPSIRDFLMSCLFTSDDQNSGASASASVLPVNIQGWSPLRLTGLISLPSKGLSGVFSSTTVWRHQFFGILPSLWSSSYNHTWPLGRPEAWLYGPLLAESCLCFSIHCLGLSLLSCPDAIIFWFHGCSHYPQWFLEPKRKSVTISTFSPSICHAVMGLDAMILVFLIFSLKLVLSLSPSPSSRGSLVPLHFLPLEWSHLCIWGCWCFSHLSWFQLVTHPAQHFSLCAQHIG